jgi:SAM-dependent methyltransferase
LLRRGIPAPGGVWADFGSGTGAFTLALAELVGPTAQIYSVDKEFRALHEQELTLRARQPQVMVHFLVADFAHHLDLPPLDGIVMANALHFQPEKEPTVRLLHSYLRPGGRLILVEYNVDRGNPWIPYPLSYEPWETLARRSGFASTQLLATRPSRFLEEFYSALSLKAK